MDTKNISLIGVDLGGTKVAAGRVDNMELTKVITELIPAMSENEQDVIDSIAGVIEKLFDENVKGIGIGIPGLVDREKGIAYDIQNIPSWKEVHLKYYLEGRFKVPVYLDNDANCFALGESRFGSGKDEKDFVGLTIGTGMGGGIIKDGFLISDAHCDSGEFGNIMYLDSIYEDYCSGKYFKDKYNTNGEDLAKAAAKGDETALKAYREFGVHMGNAIKTIMLSVDPRKVIIGGSVAHSKEFFEESMWETIKDFPFPAALTDFEVIFSDVKNIAVLGAASLYLDRNKQ
jgi:glucokinase